MLYILTHASVEWQIVNIAIATYAKVDVSIYDTLGKNVVGESLIFQLPLLSSKSAPSQNTCNSTPSFCVFLDAYAILSRITHSHVSVVFTSADHIPALLKLKPKIPMLRMIVSVDNFTPETKNILSQWGQSVDITVMDLSECEQYMVLIESLSKTDSWIVEALGEANLVEPTIATPDQLVSICYTSASSAHTGYILSLLILFGLRRGRRAIRKVLHITEYVSLMFSADIVV